MTRTSFYACLLLLAGHAPLLAQTAQRHPYYPLNVGDRWIYRVVDLKAPTGKKNAPREVTIEVERQEIYSRKDERKKDDKDNPVTSHIGFILKATSGSKTTRDHVVILSDGVHRVHTAGTPMTPPLLFFKLGSGEPKWEVNSISGNEVVKGTYTWRRETVKVPAGEFKDAVAVLFTNGKKDDIERTEVETWFAENVGMVKQRIRQKGHEHALELEKFIAKR